MLWYLYKCNRYLTVLLISIGYRFLLRNDSRHHTIVLCKNCIVFSMALCLWRQRNCNHGDKQPEQIWRPYKKPSHQHCQRNRSMQSTSSDARKSTKHIWFVIPQALWRARFFFRYGLSYDFAKLQPFWCYSTHKIIWSRYYHRRLVGKVK